MGARDRVVGAALEVGAAGLALTGRLLPGKQDQSLPASPAVHRRLPPDAAASVGQLLLVDSPSWPASRAVLTAWERRGQTWRVAAGPVPARLGPRGLTHRPTERDWFTPVGVYRVTHLFGSGPDPGGAWPWLPCTGRQVWVDDVASPLYNTWQEGPPDGRWSSAEDLATYPCAIAYGVNTDPVVPNGNSAVFLHGRPDRPTAGCVAVDDMALLRLAGWLDPALSPHVALAVRPGGPDEVLAGGV